MNSLHTLQISIDDQVLRLLEQGKLLDEYPISTAEKGMGFDLGSNRTPTGRFRISEKIGGDQPLGTIFKARQPVGLWDGVNLDGDLILSRILRLEGLDSENRNTLERYIYIHGTNREDQIGKPSSHGCIRMCNTDMVALYDRVNVGDVVVIEPATQKRGKLLFIDCDSTLSVIEGIDELGRACGDEVFSKVVALTEAAMNGEIAISEVFPGRMDLIRPDRDLCDEIAVRYIEQMVEGVPELLQEARGRGWLPVILSGGFAPLIAPLAKQLGIEHIEAVPIEFCEDGSYADYGRDYPTTRNFGKNEIIREWKAAVMPERVVMIGDGVSDLETTPDVDLFVGFGGVVARPKVLAAAGYWLADMKQRDGLWQAIDALDSPEA